MGKKKMDASTKFMIALGIFTVIMFVFQLIPHNSPPIGLPDWPYDVLSNGGLVGVTFFGFFWLSRRIENLGDKIDVLSGKIDNLSLSLLGSLKDTYSEFRDELRNRLTKTSKE